MIYAPGLTPGAVLEKLDSINVHLPTTLANA